MKQDFHRPPQQFVQEPAPQPQPRRPPKSARWWLLAVPLLFLVAAWLAQGVRPAVTWVEVMETLRVPQESRERYTQMAMLGVLICAALGAYRVLRKS